MATLRGGAPVPQQLPFAEAWCHRRSRMVLGRLLDSRGEFFVQQTPLPPPEGGGGGGQAALWHHGFQARASLRACAATSSDCDGV